MLGWLTDVAARIASWDAVITPSALTAAAILTAVTAYAVWRNARMRADLEALEARRDGERAAVGDAAEAFETESTR